MTRENGDRIGYEVVQPATFSQCPPLPGTAERGKVMYAAIFKQQEPGVVDVYVTTYVETQGAILDKVVVGITWKAMLRFWDAPQLAEMKKLQSCIATRGLERRQEQGRPSSSSSSTSTSTSSSASACKRCFERPSMMRRFSTIGHGDKSSCCCALCASSVCSSCRAERILKVTDKSSGKLKDRRVIVCQSCLVLVQQLRPTEIAMLNRKHRSGQPSR
ncbi:hypothetical protein ON010_g11729 [Phytophthora cinnamomi]|nr:hypothetical protein ON010_g11729 [Phytophthora cinnamomi]